MNTNNTTAEEAMNKAIEAWQSQTSHEYSTDALEAACWAFYEHMITVRDAARFTPLLLQGITIHTVLWTIGLLFLGLMCLIGALLYIGIRPEI